MHLQDKKEIIEILTNIDKIEHSNVFKYPEWLFSIDMIIILNYHGFKPVNSLNCPIDSCRNGYIKVLTLLEEQIIILLQDDNITLYHYLPDGYLNDTKRYDFQDSNSFIRGLNHIYEDIKTITNNNFIKSEEI